MPSPSMDFTVTYMGTHLLGHSGMLGDEPFRTEDSNRFGPVPLGLIESKLSYIIWPLSRMGPLGQPIVARPDATRGSPDWHKSKADLEREKWRNSRVTIAPSSTPAS